MRRARRRCHRSAGGHRDEHRSRRCDAHLRAPPRHGSAARDRRRRRRPRRRPPRWHRAIRRGASTVNNVGPHHEANEARRAPSSPPTSVSRRSTDSLSVPRADADGLKNVEQRFQNEQYVVLLTLTAGAQGVQPIGRRVLLATTTAQHSRDGGRRRGRVRPGLSDVGVRRLDPDLGRARASRPRLRRVRSNPPATADPRCDNSNVIRTRAAQPGDRDGGHARR